MTNLLYMLRQMQGTELLLSYFLVMEQMSEPKITICMSLSYTLIVFIVDIGQYMKMLQLCNIYKQKNYYLH